MTAWPDSGAGGAVAGVLGACLVLYPNAPVQALVPGFLVMHVARVPALIVPGMWFVIQMLNDFLSLWTATMAAGGAAWYAHICGFLVGFVAAFVLKWRPANVQRYRS